MKVQRMKWASFADDGASVPKAAAAARIVISQSMKSLSLA
jgi:hypothetical protein